MERDQFYINNSNGWLHLYRETKDLEDGIYEMICKYTSYSSLILDIRDGVVRKIDKYVKNRLVKQWIFYPEQTKTGVDTVQRIRVQKEFDKDGSVTTTRFEKN